MAAYHVDLRDRSSWPRGEGRRAGPASAADAPRAQPSRQTQQSAAAVRAEPSRLLHLTAQMSDWAQCLRGPVKVKNFLCSNSPSTGSLDDIASVVLNTLKSQSKTSKFPSYLNLLSYLDRSTNYHVVQFRWVDHLKEMIEPIPEPLHSPSLLPYRRFSRLYNSSYLSQ